MLFAGKYSCYEWPNFLKMAGATFSWSSYCPVSFAYNKDRNSKGAGILKYVCRHFFVDSNSSQGYVSLITSNTAGLERFERLTGYPQEFVNRLYICLDELAQKEKTELQVIHDCISGEIQGALLPKKGYGFWNIPLYRADIRHVSGLLWGEYLDDIRKNLGFAYERFGDALKIHDDWEKFSSPRLILKR